MSDAATATAATAPAPDAEADADAPADAAASFYVRTLYDFTSPDAAGLSFRAGDIIEVLSCLETGWWDGLLGSTTTRGWFPSNYVEILGDADAEYELSLRAHAFGAHDTDTASETDTDLDDANLGPRSSDSPRNHTNPLLYDTARADALLYDSAALSALLPGGASALDHENAFEQLAEAAMRQHGECDAARSRDADAQSDSTTIAPTFNSSIQLKLPPKRNRSAMPSPSGNERSGGLNDSLLDRLASEAADVQLPWVVRVAEDRSSFFYFNINSQQIAHHLPPEAFSADRSQLPLISPDDLDVLCQQLGAPGKSATSLLARSEQASRAHNGLGASPSAAMDDFAHRMPPPTHPRLAPPALTCARFAAQQLQQAMAQGTAPADDTPWWEQEALGADLEARFSELTELQESMAESMNQLVNDVSEFGTVQLVWEGKGHPSPPASELARLCTVSESLGKSLSIMTERMCALIYAVGGTHFPPEEPAQGQLTSTRGSVGSIPAPLSALASARSRQHSIASLAMSDTTSQSPSAANETERARLLSPDMVSAPPNVTLTSRKVVHWLSRLILSAQTLIELNQIEAFPSPSEEEKQVAELQQAAASVGQSPQAILASASTIVNARIEARKQRVRYDATELLRAASTLSGELDLLRKRAAENVMAGLPLNAGGYPAGPEWPRRTHGILLSATGEAGINAQTMSGGSAAGWRGNGFVLPSAAQVHALRTEIDPFVNPFDVAPKTSALVSEGLKTISRRPTQTLTTSAPVLQAATGRSEDMRARLAELVALVTDQAATDQTSPSARPRLDTTALLDFVRLVLSHAGTYVALLEETDLASSLDYDADEGEEATRAQRASALTSEFIQLKQDLYDGMADLFAEAQDTVSSLALGGLDELSIPPDASARLVHAAKGLSATTEAATSTFAALAALADAQNKAGTRTLGARALVYGSPVPAAQARHVDDRHPSTPSSTAVSPTTAYLPPRAVPPVSVPRPEAGQGPGSARGSASGAGLMCLGPGLFVPDGPADARPDSPSGPPSTSKPGSRAASTSATPARAQSVSTTSSAHSAPPTGTSGPWSSLRQRSASAALSSTLSPLYSHISGRRTAQSGSLATSSAATPAPGTEDPTGDRGSVRNDKIRRLLGEELPGSLTPTSPSTPGSASAAPRSTLPPLLAPTSTSGPPASPTPTSITGSSALPSPAPPPPAKTEKVPWFLEPGIAPEDMVITPDGHVKGATLEALMVRLTIHDNFDASFNNTFLLTYRSFTTTETFLDMLFKRFRVKMPDGLTPAEQQLWTDKMQRPVQLRVFNVLKSWLETYHYPSTDRVFYPLLRTFAQDEMAALPSMQLASTQLLRLIDKREQAADQEANGSSPLPPAPRRVLGTPAPTPILPRNPKRIKLLDLDPLEVARQLTIKESDAFCNIKPFECLNKAWSGPLGDTNAPGIKAMIAKSNLLSTWVVTGILESTDPKKRALILRHWIAIAVQAQQLQNYATMSTISSTLESSPIMRLRKTWDQVPARARQQLDTLTRTMESNKNFSAYRDMIHNLNPPCVPFLGVYLTDLVFIQDGNPDYLKDSSLINFGKRYKTAGVINEIMIYQSTPFNLTPVPAIQKYIADAIEAATAAPFDHYDRSLELEPREHPDDRVSALLQDSGLI